MKIFPKEVFFDTAEKEEKEEGFCHKGKDGREAIFEEERSLRSGPKPVSPEKTPLPFCCAGPHQ